MKKLIFYFLMLTFSVTIKAAHALTALTLNNNVLRTLQDLTQPEINSYVPAPSGPTTLAYDAQERLINHPDTKIVTNTYRRSGSDFPITAIRSYDGVTVINHAGLTAASSTETHFNWQVPRELFSDLHYPPSITLHPTLLKCAFTAEKGNIIFMNFEKRNRTFLEISNSYNNKRDHPAILFGQNDEFATELDGQVVLYNQNYRNGIIITKQLERQPDTKSCIMEFNPNSYKDQLIIAHNSSLLIFNSKTGHALKNIINVHRIGDFTADGSHFYYQGLNNIIYALNTSNLRQKRSIEHVEQVTTLSCCPSNPDLFFIGFSNGDFEVYNRTIGKVFTKNGRFEKTQWIPGTQTISGFSTNQETGTQITQWNMQDSSKTYPYILAHKNNPDVISFFNILVWQINNRSLLVLPNDNSLLNRTFNTFPGNVQDELLETGKIIRTPGQSQTDSLPSFDEPMYNDLDLPPSYDSLIVSNSQIQNSPQPPVTPQDDHNQPVAVTHERPSWLRRLFAVLGIIRLQNRR